MARQIERKDAPSWREVRAFVLDLKAANDDGTVEGYGSVFNAVDSYGDIIVPGAFQASLSSHKKAGTMPAMLWQHDADKPIGVWTEMVEDSKGLRIKGQLALETTLGKEAHALLKMKALNGMSIGFLPVPGTYKYRDGGGRILTELDLWEVSLVTFPSNGGARVTDVKAVDDLATPKDAERALRDAGYSKTDATAFVSRVMRMGQQRSESAQDIAKALKAANELLTSLKS